MDAVKKKRLLKLLVSGAAVVAVPFASAGPAGATPAGYGFDGTGHVIAGAGSDTTYIAMMNLSDLYNRAGVSAGCQTVTAVGPTLNQCATGSEANDLGNWQHDTVAEANPAGSGAGIGSLNGFTNGNASVSYQGTVNALPSYLGAGVTTYGPNADFARSSRDANTSGGNVIGGGNELAVDTFWGYAQDGIQIIAWNNRVGQIRGVGGSAVTPDELYRIYTCTYTQWSDVPSLGIAPADPTNGPIVPWGMQTSSGTYNTFRDWVRNNATDSGHATFNPNSGACVRKLSTTGTPYAFENDTKPLINDPAALSASASSTDNPENWIWWGSYGDMTQFPYKSIYTRNAVQYSGGSIPVNGSLPSTSNILGYTYPISRTLFHVTRKQDADYGGATGGPALPAGGNDLNVSGATSGVGGAVREFTRWICRPNAAAHKVDPFSGTNYFSEITTGINKAGFTTIATSRKTGGSAVSRCYIHQ
jgi:ABC-type phosphate transport system substrate-binding protein